MKNFDPNSVEDCRKWLEDDPHSGGKELLLALAHAKRMTQTCRWILKQGAIGQYSVAGCTDKETGSLGSVVAAGYKTCPCCGHRIEEVPFKETDHA